MLKAYIKCAIVFLIVHLSLRWGLDLRDHPGAAGVESLAKAAALRPKGDMAAYLIAQTHLMTGLNIEAAARLSSTLAGLLGVLGLTLAGGAGMGKKGALYSGMISAVWAMTHTYALLTGKDALSYGFAACGVGLCWWGFKKGNGISIAIGVTALPISVGLSEAALPAVALGGMGLFFWRSQKTRIWLWLPVILYCAYWSWAWFWPVQTTRLDTEGHLNWAALDHGFSRLNEFRERGIPEGKFLQIGGIGLALMAWKMKHQRKLLLLWLGAALIVILSAHYLGAKTRPRYMGPAAIGMVAALGWGLAKMEKDMNKLCLFLLPFSTAILTIDTWAFFDAWSGKREKMVGSDPFRLPRAPAAWLWQYRDMPEITHRDLSLTGGVALAAKVRSGRDVATTRLRDERHRSLAAYAAISGQRHVILDPGSCCAGSPVNLACAERTVNALDQAGVDLMIPIEIEGVERIYPHESKWIAALEKAASPLESERHWLIKEGQGEGGELPCQEAAPFRSDK